MLFENQVMKQSYWFTIKMLPENTRCLAIHSAITISMMFYQLNWLFLKYNGKKTVVSLGSDVAFANFKQTDVLEIQKQQETLQIFPKS